MLNPVTALKKHVHDNPTPYIVTAACVGLVAGGILARKFAPEMLTEAAVLNKFNDEMAEKGFVVLLIDRATEDRYMNALKAAL